MTFPDRTKISEIIYVNHLIGNPKGSHTEYRTDALFHYELLYKLSGEAVITFDKKTVREKAGDLRLLPDTSSFDHSPRYTADVIEEGESINITFTSDTPLTEEILVKQYSCSPVLKNMFQKMQKYWYFKRDGYYYKCLSVLYDILATITEAEANYHTAKTYRQITPALDYIDLHYTEQDMDYAYLAKLCNISHTYMTNLFKKHFNMTPNQYVLSKKIQYACDLLNTKYYSISKISEMTGFSNVYYFSRVFKKHTGVCPSKYNTLF